VRAVRTTLDVSGLPTTVFGNRGLVWWGTVGFMLIEAFTLALCVVSYLYLRRNFLEWPPPRTELPDLLVPTIGVVVMVASNIPMYFVKKAAQDFNRAAVVKGLIICSVVGLAMLVIRVFDFAALDSRWDSHAYGSVAWTIVGFHALLIVLEIGETMGGMLLFLFSGSIQEKHFVDATDNAMYWFFVTMSWVPLYVIVYLLPRWA
jgi:heme/copper-type cytochrome/quinol oxidase subunit 3